MNHKMSALDNNEFFCKNECNDEAKTASTDLSFFVNDPPDKPQLVVRTNFTCDEIYLWNEDSIMDKMTACWSNDLKRLCLMLLGDVRQYCQSTFSNYQLLAAVELFFYTFKYAVNSKVANTQETVDFFQEQLLKYAVEHPPRSLEIFNIDASFELLQLFGRLFLPHTLVLLRAITARNVVICTQVPIIEAQSSDKKKKK